MANVLGLSLGMFCFLVTSLYVRDELTHDKWHKNSDRIYVPTIGTEVSGGYSYSSPPFALHDALLNESPGVEDIVNLASVVTESYSFIKSYEFDNQEFESLYIYATEPSFFKIFDFGLQIGDSETALDQPTDVVISAELAKKHFGKENPIGEFITLKGKGTYSISGVLKSIPSNSHLRFDLLIMADMTASPYKDYKGNWQLGWGKDYVLMRQGYTVEALTEDLKEIYEKNTDNDEVRKVGFDLFSDLYLEGRANQRQKGIFGGNKRYVYIFSIVGTLIFLVACFNYVNLKVASSFARTRDMAIRKVLGASKLSLISISVVETALVALISLLVALVSVEMSLPGLNDILGKRLTLAFNDQPSLLLLPLLVLALVLIISGIYPALVSSTFNISSLLKGSLPKVNQPILRKSIVAFQFIICAGLLSSALIIKGQAKFLINKDIGYNTENVFNISLYQSGYGRRYQQLKTELERIPQIIAITGSSLPSSMMSMLLPIEKDGNETQVVFRTGAVDLNFHEVMDIDMIMGRALSEIPESQLENAAVINETAYKSMNSEDVIGTKLARFEIVGIMKDFHVASTKSRISPVILTTEPSSIRNLQFRFRAGDRELIMSQLEELWEKLGETKPLQMSELATFYNGAFEREKVLVKIFNGLTVMLVLISFLGLLTISIFESKFRERELSIRKVLGASYLTLLRLSNGRFLWLIGVSLLISIPITHELISNWLEAFPYRLKNIDFYFLISSLGVLALSVVVLTLHGHKNAHKNPVDILRNE